MIKQIIYEYWEKKLPEVKERDLKPEVSTDLINDIVGVRRTGKTFLMFDTIQKLSKEAGKKATIYINFENRKLMSLKPNYFNQIIEFIHAEKLLEEHKKLYLFLDEVQRIKSWEKYIRSIYDEFKGKIKIFVSGSSANLLSKDYGELLTGRHLTTVVFPLSFREFLAFKDSKTGQIVTEKEKAIVKKDLEEYIQKGGFPDVVLENEAEKLLNQFFTDMLARDVLKRAEVRKEGVLEEFAYFLMSNVSRNLSFNKMTDYLNSRGIKISVPTLEHYFNLMKNAFLFFDSTIFSYKVKDQLQYPRKIYSIDTGLVNLVGFKFSKDAGRLYENVVAIELLRRFSSKPSQKLHYWKDVRGREVDFVIKDGTNIRQLIQVCYDVHRPEVKNRELKALVNAGRELKCKNLLVITKDYESEDSFKDKNIQFIPLWKWLLKDD